jgi:hypothetical protein
MLQDRNLDNVIRKVGKNTKATSGQKMVIVDKINNKILLKKPLFSSSDVEYYLLNTSSEDTCICEDLRLKVIDFANGKEIDLIIDYEIQCSQNKAEQVALALSGNNSPVDELDKKLKSLVKELTKSRVLQLIDDFSVEKEKLVRDLKLKVKDTIGLEFEVKISYNNSNIIQDYEKKKEEKRKEEEEKRKKEIASQLRVFSPNPFQVSVKVSDYDEDLNLLIQVVLEIEEEQQLAAIDNHGYEDKLVIIIREETKRYFLANVKLHQFLFSLQDDVSQRLKTDIDLRKSLSAKGRKIGRLFLTSESISLVKNRLSLEESLSIEQYPVLCRIKGYDGNITILNDLQLKLEDAGKYAIAVTSQQIPLNSGKPSLNKWIEAKLHDIIKSTLLSETYIQVLLGFDESENRGKEQPNYTSSKQTRRYSEEIKDLLAKELKNIGYKEKYIASLPDLEPFRLSEREHEFQTGEREYVTKNAKVKVKLNTSAVLMIKSLANIKDVYVRLTPTNSLQEQIENAIHNTVSNHLTAIDPERFYLYFNDSDQNEDKTLEQELIEKVKAMLKEEFSALVSRVIHKTIDTEIIELVKGLRTAPMTFEIKTKPLKGGEPIIYRGGFKVDGYRKEKWETLLGKLQYWIKTNANVNEEIEKAIETYLGSKLDTLLDSQLKYTELNQRDSLENVFNSRINDPNDQGSIPNQFGLQIAIFSFTRSRTDIEEMTFGAQTDLEKLKIKAAISHAETRASLFDRRQKEIDKLYEKRYKLIDSEDSEEEIKELDKKIQDIQKEIGSPSLEAMDNALKKINPKDSERRGWDVFAEGSVVSEPSTQSMSSTNSATRKNLSEHEVIKDEEQEHSTIIDVNSSNDDL